MEHKGHFRCAPGLRGNSVSLPSSSLLAVSVLVMSFIRQVEGPPLCGLLRAFVVNDRWVLSNCFSAFIEIIAVFLFSLFLSVDMAN